VNRVEWQQLAEDRLLDAQALLAAGRWSCAYYVAGYAVECGLKACVLAYIERTGAIFEDRRYSEKCWTHDPETLVGVAELDADFGAARGANPILNDNWEIVLKWSETSRYQRKTQPEAEALYNAIADNVNGVLQWIRGHW
jgi:hypothetical protein